MVDFDKFKKAQKKVYDPKDDKVTRGGSESFGYIQHAGDFACRLDSFRFGRVDNAGSKIDKHHFLAVTFAVEKIRWQADTLPQKPSDAEAGKAKISATPLKEGQKKELFVKLPKRFFDDPDEYTVRELHMIGDACDLLAAVCRVNPEAVDLSEFHDGEGGLGEDDGAPLKGTAFGLAYKESIVEADPKKNRNEGAYINEHPYPVDPDTLEREDPAVIAERTAAVLEG